MERILENVKVELSGEGRRLDLVSVALYRSGIGAGKESNMFCRRKD
ncbi:hypothetical protein [Lutispora thermophila]|nr:hypothetical protein [Lutispora thermophila]